MPDITVKVTNPTTKIVTLGNGLGAVSLSDYVKHSETGAFASIPYVDSEIAATGAYLTGLIQASNAGVSTINGASGNLTFTGAGNVTITKQGQTFTISGSGGGGAGDLTQALADTLYYPRTGNPSGYVRSSETGAYSNTFVSKSETGAFDNTFVAHTETGVYTNTFVSKTETGAYDNTFVAHSETGIFTNTFPTHVQTGDILVGKNNTGAYSGTFVLKSETGIFDNTFVAHSETGIYTNTFVSKSETGAYDNTFVSHVETGVYTNTFVSKTETGAYDNTFVAHTETGFLTGRFYPRTGNPSGYVTTSETGAYSNTFVLKTETGAYDNTFVSHAETGNFSSISYVNNVSGVLGSRIDSTGSYLYGLIQASSAGVSALNGQSGTLTLTGAGNVTVITQGQTIFISGTGGAGSGDLTQALADTLYYPRTSNPSGYVRTGETGAYSNTFVSHVQTGATLVGQNQTGNLVGVHQTGAYTNTFVSKTETGAYDNTFISHAESGAFYPRLTNPSGYITSSSTGSFATTGYVNNVSGELSNRLVSTGAYLTGLITQLNNLTGEIILSGAGNISVTSTGNSITISGSGLATTSYVTGISGYLQNEVDSTGSYLYGLIQASSAGVSSLNSQSGTLTLTGAGTVTVVTQGQTLLVSGNAGDYVLRNETGAYTGTFPTHGQTGTLLVGVNQTGAYTNTFVQLSQTGIFDNTFVSHAESGILSEVRITGLQRTLVNLTGVSGVHIATGLSGIVHVGAGALQLQIDSINSNTGVFVTTGQTGSFVGIHQTGAYTNTFPTHTQTGNLLVGVNQTGAYVNTFPTHTQTGNLLVGVNQTGAYTNTFVQLSQTGQFVGDHETGIFSSVSITGLSRSYVNWTGASGVHISTGVSGFVFVGGGQLLNQINTITGVTGSFVTTGQTGAYTNTFVSKTETGAYDNTFVSHVESGVLTGSFYPLTSNPSGYVQTTQTGAYTNTFVLKTETGIFDNTFVSHVETGDFYPRNNPSGYITSANAGVSSINGETGVILLTGLGNVTVTKVGTTIRISGSGSAGEQGQVSGKMFLRSMFIESPTSNENISWFYNKESVLLNSLVSLVSGTGASVGWTLRQTPNVSQDGGLVASGYTDSMTTGNLLTGFSNATLSGDVFVTFKTQSTGGALGSLSLTMIGEEVILSGAGVGDSVLHSETGVFASSDRLVATGAYLTGLITQLNNLTGEIGLTGAGTVSVVTGSGNMLIISGTSIDTGQFVGVSQTGQFIGTNQSGQFVGTNQTGQFVGTNVSGSLYSVSNVGSGSGLFVQTVGGQHQFKSIGVVDSGLYLSGTANTLYIRMNVGQNTGMHLTGHLTIPTANSYQPVISGSVSSGVYLLQARVNVASTGNAVIRTTAKIWDGTTNYCAHSATCPAMGAGISGYVSINMGDVLNLTGASNMVAMAVANNFSGGMILSSPNFFATGMQTGTATSIDLIRLF